MVNKLLHDVLDYIKDEGRNPLDRKISRQVYFSFSEKKPELFEAFKKDIRAKWGKFQEKNKKYVIKKTFTTFLHQNFNSFFSYFISTFFGLDKNKLELNLEEKISNTNVFFEYSYYLENEELRHISSLYEGKDIPTSLIFVGLLYNIVSTLGQIIKKIINKKVYILLDASVLKEKGDKKFINFFIVAKDSREDLFFNYLDMTLYYFLKQIKGIPEEYFDKLLEGREILYEKALKAYPNIKEDLIDLLYYFYKKCKVLQNFYPILDFLNFVCARVEDSIFEKLEIIEKEYLVNFDFTVEKKNSLLKIFDYLDKKSTLYSTFLANDLPSPKAQFNLWLLYMKYYFGSGIEALEVSDILYLPELFKQKINEINLNDDIGTISAVSINNIGKFINFASIMTHIEDIDSVFKKIFNMSVSDKNYHFFRTFLRSFNTKLFSLIENENKKLMQKPDNQPLTFNIVIDHICRMLYTLIDYIFLVGDTPDSASKNFNDPRGRYVGKNIALRVLELLFFQDMNFSDDIWPEYLISINKERIKDSLDGIKIPEKLFYPDEVLMKYLITNNFYSEYTEKFFEEWIINEIIVPLNDFIEGVKKSVKDPSNTIEVYEKLSEIFIKGQHNKETIKELKFVCQQLAPFWSEAE